MTTPASLAEILAAAFATDPLMEFVQPDPERRRAMLPWFMGCAVRAGRARGVVDEVPGAGAAVWIAPPRSVLDGRAMLRAGFWAAPWRMGWAAARRFQTVDADLATAPPAAHDRFAWYLFLLGVDPAAQGGGVGRRLLEQGLARADAERAAVRLETNAERNLGIYERFGFEVTSEHRAVLPQWTMVRPARG